MKHLVSNKIRMAKQETYLDNNPCVLIVPAVDLNFVLGWRGEGYPALVMVGEVEGDDARIGTICTDIRLKEAGPVASSDDIELARSVLSQVVRAMAYSLHKRSEHMGRNLSEALEKDLRMLRDKFIPLTLDGVSVPEATGQESLRVRLVTFEDAASSGPGHPAPDPLLLAVRAAINWSRRHGQDLLAAAEHKEVVSDLDDLGIEQFQEWQDQQRRADTMVDVTVGLRYMERRGSAARLLVLLFRAGTSSALIKVAARTSSV